MATVRIYKVAELLNTSSQEVMALLKRDHGIEVKSASSTIEEVVAREFVSRLARQRNLNVPSNASFADTPAAAKGKKPAGKAEPPKPAAPSLPPPRLVKSAKPATPPPEPMAAPPAAAETVLVPAPSLAPQPAAIDEPEPQPLAEQPGPEPVQEPVPAAHAQPSAPEEPRIAAHAPEAATVEPSVEPPTTAAPSGATARPAIPAPTGRVVPPTIRLRVEDPRTGQAPPAPPRRPVLVRPPAPPAPSGSQAPTGNLSKAPAGRPAAPGAAARAPQRPAGGGIPPRPGANLGGPSPLPAQPVRPAAPPRPGMPAYRPPMHHRPSTQRPGGAKREAPRVQMREPTATIRPKPTGDRLMATSIHGKKRDSIEDHTGTQHIHGYCGICIARCSMVATVEDAR